MQAQAPGNRAPEEKQEEREWPGSGPVSIQARRHPATGASLQPCPPPAQQEQAWPGNLCPPAEVESRLRGQQKTVLKDGFKGRGPRAQTPLSQNSRPPLSLADIGTQAIRARCFQGLSVSPCKLCPQACVVGGPGTKGSFLYLVLRKGENAPWPIARFSWLSKDVIFCSGLSKHAGAKPGTVDFSVCHSFNKHCAPLGEALQFSTDGTWSQPSEAHCPCI